MLFEYKYCYSQWLFIGVHSFFVEIAGYIIQKVWDLLIVMIWLEWCKIG